MRERLPYETPGICRVERSADDGRQIAAKAD